MDGAECLVRGRDWGGVKCKERGRDRARCVKRNRDRGQNKSCEGIKAIEQLVYVICVFLQQGVTLYVLVSHHYILMCSVLKGFSYLVNHSCLVFYWCY